MSGAVDPADQIDAADVVLHRPSGESWIVAAVVREEGTLSPCGYPPTYVKLADCDLLQKASESERDRMLTKWICRTHRNDVRHEMAKSRRVEVRRESIPPMEVTVREIAPGLIHAVDAELSRARVMFPRASATMAALTEEVGELAKALMDESPERVRQEAIQVIVMAIRVITEGDESLAELRQRHGLQPVGATPAPAGQADQVAVLRERFQAFMLAFRRLRQTPIIDDDFPRVRDELDQEIARCEKALGGA